MRGHFEMVDTETTVMSHCGTRLHSVLADNYNERRK